MIIFIFYEIKRLTDIARAWPAAVVRARVRVPSSLALRMWPEGNSWKDGECMCVSVSVCVRKHLEREGKMEK